LEAFGPKSPLVARGFWRRSSSHSNNHVLEHPSLEMVEQHWTSCNFAQTRFLRKLAKNPLRYFDRISTSPVFVSPDLSMYRILPRSMRVFHTIVNRGVGAVLQSRGVEVIPNVAWSSPKDYDFCFLGIESRSAVAISSHGRIRDPEDRYYFEHGVVELVERLSPRLVILYGASTRGVDRSLKSVNEVWKYPCHQSEVRNSDG